MQPLVEVVKRHVPASTRTRLTWTRVRLRAATGNQRVLPDFLIIGAMRGGTSSLYKYLGHHAQVAPSVRKETRYFTEYYQRGEAWYRAHFPLTARARLWSATGRPLLSFEACPDYLFHPLAAERAARLLPHARLVVLLRDPVERAVSHYHHMSRLGLEPLPLREALAAEPARLQAGPGPTADNSGKSYLRYSYVARGQYADQVERWLQHYPREQLLALRSEDFFRDSAATVRRIMDFVGLGDTSAHRVGHNYSYLTAPPQREEPHDGVRSLLAERFAGSNARLGSLLGEGWRSAWPEQ